MMLMQLTQAWNMRMTVPDSRNYREIVEMLVVGIVRIHVRTFHGVVGMPYARDTPSNTSRYPRPSMRRPPEATS
ncbi:hypothetical protein GGI1_00465 [Acidithiobacillus sp. GGI-221]|uniref:Uncharacterized protein n=2 Tax=Acidithiobacillus ferrooxidans TaxID=920 RepID=A0A2W1K1T6_ACIFR|nr:hypothetical protein GGI1_00465 [Acidithiobacillus sp. GGI-221]PZD80463.1 hypothetical protein DN052_13320 [Acidithiobacillus ferrooxidans]